MASPMASRLWAGYPRAMLASFRSRPLGSARAFVAGALFAASVRSAPAFAQTDPTAEARAAYARAAKAYDRGQYAAAAVDFALADERAPNPVALRLAIDAAILADDPVLGMTLAERAEARSDATEAAEIAAKARLAFASRAGRLSITCPGRLSCRATVDGTAATMGVLRWIKPGDHPVEIFVEGSVDRQLAHVEPGATVEVSPAVPAPRPEPRVIPPAPRPAPLTPRPASAGDAGPGGLSPAWFFVGLGATALLGGVTVGSGVDTAAKRSSFLATPTDATESAGRAAQHRTNILLAVTGGAALVTGAVGLFAVRWSAPTRAGAPRAERRSVVITATGPALTLTARY